MNKKIKQRIEIMNSVARPVILVAVLACVAATTLVKISQYPAVTSPGTNDLILLASGPTNKNCTWSNAVHSITLTESQVTSLTTDLAGKQPTNSNLTGWANIATNALADASVATTAAIAKSKISTNSTWAVADIPALPESQITSLVTDLAGKQPTNSNLTGWANVATNALADANIASGAAIAESKISGLTSDLAGKLATSGGTATNLSIAGGTMTSTNLTWNTETLSPSSGTNFVLDFLAPRTALITATNDVNWLNSTNRTSSTATELNKKVRIFASGANRTVTLHSSWMLVGSTTRTFTVTNGTYLVMALDNAGSSETNVFAGATYAQ